MYYTQAPSGEVGLTLTAHEAQRLEDFLAMAAMSHMTWPIVVGDYMTERKARKVVQRERRPEGADPPAA
jgi:hypothetical protein